MFLKIEGCKFALKKMELYTGSNGILSQTKGFRILIHNSSDPYTFPEEFGIDVSPGSLTNVEISRTYVKRLAT